MSSSKKLELEMIDEKIGNLEESQGGPEITVISKLNKGKYNVFRRV